MSYFDTAKKKAASDRHWKQVETGLMTAGAAAAVFLVKTAIEHMTTKPTPRNDDDENTAVRRILRGF